nr:FecR domain-containing protein [Tenacibaculum mesophilum]
MEITPELLTRYAEGKCTETERKRIEEWVNTTENEIKFPETNIETSSHIEEKLWNAIAKDTIKSTKRDFFFRWSVAATFTVFLLVSAFFVVNKPIIYTTQAGEVRTIVLKDSTRITLNALSSLEVSREYGKTHRNVILKGEGYFKVEKNAQLPFVIKTEKTVTKVLGTKFNLSAYTGEDNVIFLDEGKVFFFSKKEGKEKGMTLNPKEKAILVKERLVKKVFKDNDHTAWMQQKLIFKDETLSSVIKVLERFYNCSIEIKKEELKRRKYNGIHTKESIDTVMKDIGFVLNFNFKKTGDRIIIF